MGAENERPALEVIDGGPRRPGFGERPLIGGLVGDLAALAVCRYLLGYGLRDCLALAVADMREMGRFKAAHQAGRAADAFWPSLLNDPENKVVALGAAIAFYNEAHKADPAAAPPMSTLEVTARLEAFFKEARREGFPVPPT